MGLDLDYAVARNLSSHRDVFLILETGSRFTYLHEGDILVFHPKKYIDLVNWFKTHHQRLGALVNILIEYDLPMLVGTHSMMSRRIARFKKFLKILDMIIISADFDYISLSKIFEREYNALEASLEALRLVEEETHRPRDWVHQLTYPYIRRALEGFLEKRIWFKPSRYDSKYAILARFSYNPWTLEEHSSFMLDTEKSSEPLNWSRLNRLLDKIIERRGKKRNSKPEHEILIYLDKNMEVDS